MKGVNFRYFYFQNGSAGCIKTLVQCPKGAELVNVADYSGKTPVHFAAAAGYAAIIQDLANIPDCDIEALDPDER